MSENSDNLKYYGD